MAANGLGDRGLTDTMALIRAIVQSPTLINSISNSNTNISPAQQCNSEAVNREITSLLTPGSTSSMMLGSNSNMLPAFGSTNRSMQQPASDMRTYVPRYETRATFSSWKSKPRQRKKTPKTPFHGTFNKDVILLHGPTDDVVVKQATKEKLYKRGHILNAFEFDKSWDHVDVLCQIRNAFKGKIPDLVSCEILMACGNKLIAPALRDGQELDASLIQKVFKLKAVYVRPSQALGPEDSDRSSSEEDEEATMAVPSVTTRAGHKRTHPVGDHPDPYSQAPFSTAPPSLGLMSNMASTSTTPPSLGLMSNMAGSPASTGTAPHRPMSNMPSTSTAPPSPVTIKTPSPPSTTNLFAESSDYRAYLSVLNVSSDDDEEDEGLYAACVASLEDQIQGSSPGSVPIKQILSELGLKINNKLISRFNINRASVLDGAIRGFKRISYDPTHRMSVRFSDDKGRNEEAVDLGGPRREFLRLMTESLIRSPMFEGNLTEGNLNLALDASADKEDRYYIAGRAIAVSLVHGGPSPNCFSKTLFNCLVRGPGNCRPILEDVTNSRIHDIIEKISESTTQDELTQSTEPHHDFLENAGCLNNRLKIDDKDRLVEDILRFQVINRVRAPFERFREGLKTLGVLEMMQNHPDSFRPVMCFSPKPLTADDVDALFQIGYSEVGSNKRTAEERVVAWWRDYLQDVEEEDGAKKLGDILAFATGSDAVPPIGFSPQPSLDFHPSGGAQRFPVANTCINCLKLPIYSTYNDFKSNFDYALRNTQGFGMA